MTVLCGIVASVVAADVTGQSIPLPDKLAQREARHQLRRSVVQQLRDGAPDLALKALEVIDEAPTEFFPIEVDGFGTECAGLHRTLEQLGSEAQFDLLNKWSLPAGRSTKVRVITSIVPRIAPPIEFARALGERPRESSFPISSIGGVPGIYCSAWSLVNAARGCGHLQRLIADLTPLVENKVANAELVMALALIADDRSDVSKLAERLSLRVSQLRSSLTRVSAQSNTIDPADLVIACASLHKPKLRQIGEEMLTILIQSPSSVRSFLRHAHAIAIVPNRDLGKEPQLPGSQLEFWTPALGRSAVPARPPTVEAIWLAHEDHILHLAGEGDDLLLFRYPLLGDFQFQCDAQCGGRLETDGGLIYGGYSYQTLNASGDFRVWDPSGRPIGKRYAPFARHSSRPTFNCLSITSAGETATLAVNQHPAWKDRAVSSPWIGLRSSGDHRPLFRNLKITGQPKIPRVVNLTDGEALRGWQSRVYGDPLSQSVLTPTEVPDIPGDWAIVQGEVRAPKRNSTGSTSKIERLLSYQRPLLAGEEIRFEFFYEPGICEFSPALGRLAFLLQPEGVRIHWLTEGDVDWTGLSADNAVTEPLNRRGPRPFPLKLNDWNRVKIARIDQELTLSLNAVVIYQRPIDWSEIHSFGIYQLPSGVESRVRDIVLSGNWPESLPQDFMNSPALLKSKLPTDTELQTLNRIFQEEFLAENVFATRRRALAMPAKQRFEFLCRWVIPESDRGAFRVAGEFTTTQPAPAAREPAVSNPDQGGEIVSPVFDLLDAAKDLGRLAECRERVANARVPNDEFQQRARQMLLMLLSLEQNDEQAAAADFEKLFVLLKAQIPTGIEDQWPELLVMDRGVRNFPKNASVRELVNYIHSQRTQQRRPANINFWHHHVAALWGRLRLRRIAETETGNEAPAELKDWIPVTASRSSSRGPGAPNPFWLRTGNQVAKLSCHDDDYLFYRLPLSGNYEVECEFTEPGTNAIQVMTAGSFVGPRWDRTFLEVGTWGRPPTYPPIDPAFPPFQPWVHFRSVVRGGICTVTLNGRQVHTASLPPQPDPWIAVHCSGRLQGAVRDFRISGSPTVLKTVPLSGAKDLGGWISYHGESVACPNSDWSLENDSESNGVIVGRSNLGLTGTSSESLLRYQRPLVEDGSIEYEFFWKPDAIETHPALDRLAFVLTSNGVREHWITDGQYDRTELAPGKVTDLPANRRGPAKIPLKSNNWNKLKLTLKSSTIGIELNGRLIYERALEQTNQRTFGLFHYTGDSEVRVRNVIMRGDWPKVLPSFSDQELTEPLVDSLDAELPRLKAVFAHNFQKDGLPVKYFKPLPLSTNTNILINAEGVRVAQSSTDNWTSIELVPRFALTGDFDVQATFVNARLESTKNSGVMLTAMVDEPRKPHFRAVRIRNEAGRQEFQISYAIMQGDGNRAYLGESKPCEALNGRLRLARRGDKVYYLFAEGDSNHFQHFGTENSLNAPVEREGIQLQSICNGLGSSTVTWTGLVIRAEQMTYLPEKSTISPPMLRVMNSDGTGLKTIMGPEAIRLTHLGSPEWSADGRRIVLDVSDGSTTASHVVIVNSDGTDVKDLGPGCMPSFSADGKQIVFSHTSSGIVAMNSNGTNREVIDPSGWGAQWSPDGKWIAYGKGGNIVLLDVKTHKSRQLLVNEFAKHYVYVYWNSAWSHDSRSIAFKARNRDATRVELCVVDVDSPSEVKVLNAAATSISEDMTWSMDNQQVVVCMASPSADAPQLHAIDRMRPKAPQLLSISPGDQKIYGVAWSRDGKFVVMSSQQIPQPVEWIDGPVTDRTTK